jgi:hypothetical protein
VLSAAKARNQGRELWPVLLAERGEFQSDARSSCGVPDHGVGADLPFFHKKIQPRKPPMLMLRTSETSSRPWHFQ